MRGPARRPRTQAQASARRAQLWAATRALLALAVLAAVGRALGSLYAGFGRAAPFVFPAAALPPSPPPPPRRNAPPPPRRIPRVVHQTLAAPGVAPRRAGAAAALASWSVLNPGWRVQRYDDAAAAAFVAAEFPEHAAAYAALPAAVQRADLFRVLVLLRKGGVYADADAACVAPLDALLQPDDTLVVGWENAFDTPEQAHARHYVRQRQASTSVPVHDFFILALTLSLAQVLNWVFAAAPGHPALRDAASAIVAAASGPTPIGGEGGARGANAAVLERTGPGVWTDALLTWYARAAGGGMTGRGQAVRGGAGGFGLRVLPRVAFGTHPRPGSADGVPQRAPEVVVAHGFAGGWKRKDGVQALPWPLRPLLRPLARAAAAALPSRRDGVPAAMTRQRAPFYPVSAAWSPPFDVLLPPPATSSEAATSAAASAAAHLLAWGAPAPRASPPPAHALLAPLLRPGVPGAGRAILLDIGAAHGFYALAAVASGAAASAFEPHGDLRLLLERSRAASGLDPESLRVHNTLLGDASAAFCAAWRRLGGARGAGLRHGRAVPEHALLLPGMDCALPKGHATLDDVARHAREHFARDGDGATPGPMALRLAVGGWEGFVLDGGAALLGGSAPPATVLVELHPRRLQRTGWGDAAVMTERMAAWGYSRAAHAGPACDAARRREPEEAQPPEWCVLTRDAAARLARDVPAGQTEALLFMRD